MGKGVGGYPLDTGGQEGTLVQVWFTTANGSSPTTHSEPTGANYVSGVTRDGEGSLVIALVHDWFRIRPISVHCMSTTARFGQIDAVSTTAGANTVSVTTFLANGTADDLPGDVVVVTFMCYRR